MKLKAWNIPNFISWVLFLVILPGWIIFYERLLGRIANKKYGALLSFVT